LLGSFEKKLEPCSSFGKGSRPFAKPFIKTGKLFPKKLGSLSQCRGGSRSKAQRLRKESREAAKKEGGTSKKAESGGW
jgi:hypothetical protein